MGAVSKDLLIEQGVTWSQAWQVQLDGVDLSVSDGWVAFSQVRTSVADPAVLHEFLTSVTYPTGAGSVVQLAVLPTDSAAWLWRRGVYDVEIVSNSVPPRVVRIVQGSVLVSPEVTREGP